MKNFLVLYRTPVSVLEGWMDTPAEEREASEKQMRDEWTAWMEQHGSKVKDTRGAGSTKRVAADGVIDTKNDVMLYSIVEAESAEEVAKMFETHPHLSIPESTIDIMVANPVPGT